MHLLSRRAFCACALALCLITPALRARAEALPPLTANGAAALDRNALIRAVLARNPSLAAGEAAVRAAEARASAAGSFADPTLTYALAPRSLARGPRSGHRVELAQPIASWGKRGLARDTARGEAAATQFDLSALRLDLALAASQLYDDYYFAARGLAVNAAHRGLVDDLLAAALARYEAGRAPKQAPLAAELEAARLEHREVELQSLQRITAAQLNALLHRAPDAELPPAPAALAAPAHSPPNALASERPELRAAAARSSAREAEAALARRERIPDVTLMAGYDGMWDAPEMRPMIGFEVALPLQRARRRAAIAEADALQEQAASEQARAESEAQLALAIARERLAEAEHALGILRDQVLPAARDQAEALQSALASGRAEFADALEAERSWYEAELEAEQALVEASRRAAELNRALGKSGLEDVR